MGDLVLGIETSCDDTSVALVDQNGQIAAIETVSQYEVHSEFGGVYPELASRAHLEAILPTIETVMARAGAHGIAFGGPVNSTGFEHGLGSALLWDQPSAWAYPQCGFRRKTPHLSGACHVGVGWTYAFGLS